MERNEFFRKLLEKFFLLPGMLRKQEFLSWFRRFDDLFRFLSDFGPIPTVKTLNFKFPPFKTKQFGL